MRSMLSVALYGHLCDHRWNGSLRTRNRHDRRDCLRDRPQRVGVARRLGTERHDRLLSTFSRGPTHRSRGHHRGGPFRCFAIFLLAIRLQKLIDHRGAVYDSILGALARLQLARAQVLSGDLDAARTDCQDLLALWKDADPDIPVLRQAKAEYERLK